MVEGANTFENLKPIMKEKYTKVKNKLKRKSKNKSCCCDKSEKK